MEQLFVAFLNRSISACSLILVVVLLRALLRRAPRWIHCLLWLLVAIRLVCPLPFHSPLSVYQFSSPAASEKNGAEYLRYSETPEKPRIILDLNEIPFLSRANKGFAGKFEIAGNSEITDISGESLADNNTTADKSEDRLAGSNKEADGNENQSADANDMLGAKNTGIADNNATAAINGEQSAGNMDAGGKQLAESNQLAGGSNAAGEGKNQSADTNVSSGTENAGIAGSNQSDGASVSTAEHMPDLYLPFVEKIWLLGMLGILLYVISSMYMLRQGLKEAVPYEDNIWMSDYVRSPFIFGILRPRIYLSSDMHGEEMAYVIAHERAHLARGDHWWKPVGYLLLGLHWFNPFCWLAYFLFCRDIELACDERVIRDMDLESKKAYSTALLNCSMRKNEIPACPLAFGEVGVKQRIRSVLGYKKPTVWAVAASLMLLALTAVCFLTQPQAADIEKGAENSAENGADDGAERTVSGQDAEQEEDGQTQADANGMDADEAETGAKDDGLHDYFETDQEIIDFLKTLSTDKDELVARGCVVSGRELFGKQRVIDFSDRYSSGQKAALTLGQYTVEGDLIFYYLRYDGEKIRMVHDSTRDAFAGDMEPYIMWDFPYLYQFDSVQGNGDAYRELYLSNVDGVHSYGEMSELMRMDESLDEKEEGSQERKAYYLANLLWGNELADASVEKAFHELASKFDEESLLLARERIKTVVVSCYGGDDRSKGFSVSDGDNFLEAFLDCYENLDFAPYSDPDTPYRWGYGYKVELLDEDGCCIQYFKPYQDAITIGDTLYNGAFNTSCIELLKATDALYQYSAARENPELLGLLGLDTADADGAGKYYPIGTYQDYEICLVGAVGKDFYNIVLKKGDAEQVLNREPCYIPRIKECRVTAFDELMGFRGFAVHRLEGYMPFTDYYGMDEGGAFLAAESFRDTKFLGSSFGDGGPDDYFADIDGDGKSELICNVTYGDGAQRTLLYRFDGGQVMLAYGDDLLDEEYDNYGIGSEYSFYLPQEEMIEIHYWKDAKNDFLTKKYKPDADKLVWYPLERS